MYLKHKEHIVNLDQMCFIKFIDSDNEIDIVFPDTTLTLFYDNAEAYQESVAALHNAYPV
jgi:hypothetical protein